MGRVYRHTQQGHLIRAAFGASLAGIVLAGLLLRAPWIVLGGALLMGILFACFHSLTVEVDTDAVTVRFGVGIIRKRFRLDEIEDAHPVRNVWWYGWGIRLTPHGWLYNVSGLDAVELKLPGKKRFRIGTDEPRRLAQAISAAKGGVAARVRA